ncbi:MAG TPA: hypothetical protein DIW37_01320 [Chryseobacterium sp.]|nr:hypothetical protein [Chryseobacterium sp.]
MNDFDLEQLERKNIYTVPEKLFETVQDNVVKRVLPVKKAPVFRLNWAYAAAASLALIFGATFVFNNGDSADQVQQQVAANKQEPKPESQIAYETLKSDLTSVENNNQTGSSQDNNKSLAKEEKPAKAADEARPKSSPSVSKQNEAQMNEYLDSFSNSEISELASNSTQDVYLDLYN